MKRLFPSPLVSAGLLVVWLLLNQTLSPGHILLGIVVAVVVPLLMAPLRPPAGPVRRPLVILRLVLRVGMDVIMSAGQVARGVTVAGRRPPRGHFVVVPLEIRDAHALAALSMITAVVPGTIWSELAPDRSALLLHVFDLDDEAEFIGHFQSRYVSPLKEIFE